MIKFFCSVCGDDITNDVGPNGDPARFGRLHRRLEILGNELHVETITHFVVDDLITPSDDKRLHICDSCVMKVLTEGEISG